MSGVEPGANGTMIRTVFAGHGCAAATAGANNSADNAAARLFFIRYPLRAMRSSAPSRRSRSLSLRRDRMISVIMGEATAASMDFSRLTLRSRAEAGTALPRDLPWPLLAAHSVAGAARFHQARLEVAW